MTDDARDVIARALFEMDGIEPPADRDHPIWHNFLTDAKAILAALAAAGVVIVPRDALAQVTQALKGPGYLIRELQAISSIQGDGCPLRQLERAMIAAGGDDG